MKKPYIPNKLPLDGLDYNPIISIVSEANRLIARYDGLLESIPNKYVFLTPLMTQEAVLSSKIEGTQATFQEVLEFEADDHKHNEKRADIEEIKNYRNAIQQAVLMLEKLPLCMRIIKKAHSVLLSGVRGSGKAPGVYRSIQNWIGPPGAAIEKASYIPPEPSGIANYLSNLEKYLNIDDKDIIIQSAIIHAQFELIHPFLDGNGRIGRMLIPLFLYSKNVMSEPVFYISEYFEANRAQYYNKLNKISSENNWTAWISFYLKAVIEQSKNNITKINKIRSLYEVYKEQIYTITKSKRIIQIIDTLFTIPIFKSSQFAKMSGIPQKTSERYIKQLFDEDLLSCDEKSRQKTYFVNKLLEILK